MTNSSNRPLRFNSSEKANNGPLLLHSKIRRPIPKYFLSLNGNDQRKNAKIFKESLQEIKRLEISHNRTISQ